MEKPKILSDEIGRLYNLALQTRAALEAHSWCRQQTKYDAEFIAALDKDLATICNKVYELTQFEPLIEQAKSEVAREMIEEVKRISSVRVIKPYNLEREGIPYRVYEIRESDLESLKSKWWLWNSQAGATIFEGIG